MDCGSCSLRKPVEISDVKSLGKLLWKSAIKYTLVQCLSALDLRLMASNREKCQDNMMLKILADAKRVNPAKCDDILQQFGELIDTTAASILLEFRDFQLSDRVDILFLQHMADSARYSYGPYAANCCVSYIAKQA